MFIWWKATDDEEEKPPGNELWNFVCIWLIIIILLIYSHTHCYTQTSMHSNELNHCRTISNTFIMMQNKWTGKSNRWLHSESSFNRTMTAKFQPCYSLISNFGHGTLFFPFFSFQKKKIIIIILLLFWKWIFIILRFRYTVMCAKYRSLWPFDSHRPLPIVHCQCKCTNVENEWTHNVRIWGLWAVDTIINYY